MLFECAFGLCTYDKRGLSNYVHLTICLTLCHTIFLSIGTFTFSDYWGCLPLLMQQAVTCIVWLRPYWYTYVSTVCTAALASFPGPTCMAWERGYSSMCSDSEYGSSYCSACDIAWGYVCVPFLGGKLAGQTHRFPAAEVAIAGPVHNTC